MTARRMVENCVLTNQTAVVDEMLNKHLLPEEYIYPFVVISGMVADRRLAGRMSETREKLLLRNTVAIGGAGYRAERLSAWIALYRRLQESKTRPAYPHIKFVIKEIRDIAISRRFCNP